MTSNPAEPVAVVGRGCVLPGCTTPDELWQAIVDNRNLLDRHRDAAGADVRHPARSTCRAGGYIRGFAQAFDPGRYSLGGIDPATLDVVVQWPLHAAMNAWDEANACTADPGRVGVVLANLSYPSKGKADHACDHWVHGRSDTPASNAFNSGLPARLIARALGAHGGAFSLDAACASSLYALRIACGRLQRGTLDVAVVAAVNAAHDVLLQQGFGALQALSPTGRSRPFAASADGLVPAHGAAAVVLKRLRDVGDHEHVHGVIRAVGLSNDGRRGGFLVPDACGQLEAMRDAYRQCDVDLDSIGYLECHATGTPVGDAVEIGSAGEFYARRSRLPVGSVKSNTGHLITVAGLASLLKLMSAFEHETLPPTRIDGALNERLEGSCLFPQAACASWPAGTPRRAAISNFGFGGNNAHLIVEQHRPGARSGATGSATGTAGAASVRAGTGDERPDRLVIGAFGALAGSDRGTDRIVRRLMSSPEARADDCVSISIDPLALRTPPADLRQAEPAQLALLAVVDDALRQLPAGALPGIDGGPSMAGLPAERIGVFAGTGCASDACRWLLRERLAGYFGDRADPATLAALADRVAAPLSAADVLGAMPNMPANRINAAYDFRAQGYSVSAEELSGTVALQLGCEALGARDIDMAVIGAADFASEPVRASALSDQAAGGSTDRIPDEVRRRFGDKACALLVMRQSTAEALGVTVLGRIDRCEGDGTAVPSCAYRALTERVYGSAPIADTLFSMVVATALALRGQQVVGRATQPRMAIGHPDRLRFPDQPRSPDTGASVPRWTLEPVPARAAPDPLRPAPHLYYASADSDRQLCALIERRAVGGNGRRRVAIVADSRAQLDERLGRAIASISARAVTGAPGDEAGRTDRPADGVHLGSGEPAGELAFAYTGSAAAYPRMGRGLLMAFPTLAPRLVTAFPSLAGAAHLLSRSSLGAFEELCAVTLVSQAHTVMLRDVLGVSPDALIGLSLGETNALYASGLWNDTSGLLDDSGIASMYEQHLGGEFLCAAEAWGTSGPVEWTNWRVYSPVAAVEAALDRLPRTNITIVYSDEDCMVGGPAEECRVLVAGLGSGRAVPMNHHLIVHTPTLQPYADTWRALHTRPTAARADVRVYGHADHESYEPTRDNIADRLTRQALQTIDFRRTVERAYADGVRTFVELGPRDTLTSSVGKILGARAHRAVATDRIDRSDAGQLARVAAELYVDGRRIDIAALAGLLEQVRHHPWTVRPARSSDVTFMTGFQMPEWPPHERRTGMPRAPTLPVPSFPMFAAPRHVATSVPEESAPEGNAVTSVSADTVLPWRSPRGPTFDRDALVRASRGAISILFGNAFEAQDGYRRQVRLPAPPLLMVDRIVGIDAEPGIEATGTIWTETDVEPGRWYLHANAMRPGPLIESGQADLSLISWMGADLRNRDERVYRLLGCEMTVHDERLPQVGDTLRYQIEITGHAEINGIRLFFFQYDCRVDGRLVISVRHGQAGFFTDAELASSKGVLVDLADEPPPTDDPPAFDSTRASSKRAFSEDDLAALRDGDAFACFGEGFEHCAAHTHPPRLPDGRLVLFDRVAAFEPAGGAWGRGYLRAVATVPVDAWFYEGHFHHDPCMPGTLMAEAAVQALECLAMAMGLSCRRDGWVFEPVPGASARFECRGQVVPDRPHVIDYEVHVDRIVDGDTPEVHAALLASCDGHKVFYCPSFGIRLRRRWPEPAAGIRRTWIGPERESRGDLHALLACGDGAPSHAFGRMYEALDAQGRAPRLPQPPYHMMSRVVSVSTRPNAPQAGASVVTEYDVPEEAWYFEDGGNGMMPFAVLLEVALQPCGWLGSHGGFALLGGECFRNLDGEATIDRNVGAIAQRILVEARMTRFSTMGAMTIVHFDVVVDSSLGHRVMTLQTSFGFFPMAALDRQVGLDTDDRQLATRRWPTTHWPVDDPRSLLPAGRMRMVDGVDFFEPSGGEAGLGLVRGYQDVDPYAWYFKAHFYQDPVQPGSLGLDALLQLLLRAIVLKGLTRDLRDPQVRFISPAQALRWSYRGQVTPGARRVTLVVELTSIERREGVTVVTAFGSLWRDELRIYEAANLSIEMLDADAAG